MMGNKWKDYINDLLISTNQVSLLKEEVNNSTLIVTYEYSIPNCSAVIKVGLLDDNILIYLNHNSELTPGYNYIHDDYFFSNDFDETIPRDEPGLDFNETNCQGVKEIISGGVLGEEIQWIKDENVLKSGVVLFDSGFYDYHDFTKRSFWQRLRGPKIRNMPGVTKKRIDLSKIFPPIHLKE